MGFNKENLFDEQKFFIIYLMGVIPKFEDWSIQVDYQTQIKEAQGMTIKDIQISDSDLDLARLQGRNIEDLKKERLIEEKKKKIAEIKDKFGIKSKEVETPDRPEGLPELSNDPNAQKKELWDLLEGRGLIKKKG